MTNEYETDLKLSEAIGVFYTSDGGFVFTIDCAECEAPVASPFVVNRMIMDEATGEELVVSKCPWCVGNDLDQAEAAGNYGLGMTPVFVPAAFEWYVAYALQRVGKPVKINGREDGFYIDRDLKASDAVCGDCGLDLPNVHIGVTGEFDTKGEITTRCHSCVAFMVDNAVELGNREIESQPVAVSTALVRYAGKALKAARFLPDEMGYGKPRGRQLNRADRRRREREAKRGWLRWTQIRKR